MKGLNIYLIFTIFLSPALSAYIYDGNGALLMVNDSVLVMKGDLPEDVGQIRGISISMKQIKIKIRMTDGERIYYRSSSHIPDLFKAKNIREICAEFPDVNKTIQVSAYSTKFHKHKDIQGVINNIFSNSWVEISEIDKYGTEKSFIFIDNIENLSNVAVFVESLNE